MLQHNIGQWAGCFIRLNGDGHEQERFHIAVGEGLRRLIQTCLTYEHTGQQRSMSFQDLPPSMQVCHDGGWSWDRPASRPGAAGGTLRVSERAPKNGAGVSGLDQVVYVVESA